MKHMEYMACIGPLIATGAPAPAAARKTFVALKTGSGSIRVNSEHAVDNVTSEKDIFGGGIFAGYIFDSGLAAEAGFSGDISEDILDSYNVFQFIAMLGYKVHAGTHFS